MIDDPEHLAALLRGDGKVAKAPCGHDGEHVVGTFVRCLHGCQDDSQPVPHCPVCFTTEIEPFWTGDGYYISRVKRMHCLPLGHVW